MRIWLLALAVIASSCARDEPRPVESFTWSAAQAIAFEPPPPVWYREAENSGGLLGVRFVLRGGLGECITVASYRKLAEEAAARSADLTLAGVLPEIRLRPERMQEPERWRIGYERDTTIAERPAFASDDTLITPERSLLYRQVFWVVNGVPFQATYQGTPPNLPVFVRLLRSIRFPEDTHDPAS